MSSLGHSIWTVAVFVIFIGIVLWAFSGSRKKDFDEAARLALDDDDKLPSSSSHTASNKQKTEE
jgi:cytochrome c oxidase cbb3-type subunit 4